MEEITSTVKLELETGVMVIRGASNVIKDLAKLLAFLVKKGSELTKKGIEAARNLAGEKSYKDLIRISNGQIPPISDVPNEAFEAQIRTEGGQYKTYNEMTDKEKGEFLMKHKTELGLKGDTEQKLMDEFALVSGKKKKILSLEGDEVKMSRFEEYAMNNGLRFHVMPDLNPYDSYTPVAFATMDSALAGEFISSENKRLAAICDEKIAKEKKKIESAKGDEKVVHEEKKEEYEKEKQDIERKKNEGAKTLEEYLHEGKESYFMKHMDKAYAGEFDKNIPMECDASKAFRTVRNEKNIPSSGIEYMVQDGSDVSVRRNYSVQAGVVCSTYDVFRAGELILSRRDLPAEEWKEGGREAFIKEAGLDPDKAFFVSQSEEQALSHFFTKGAEGGRKAGLTKDAQRFYEAAKNEELKTETYEKLTIEGVVVGLSGDKAEILVPDMPGVTAVIGKEYAAKKKDGSMYDFVLPKDMKLPLKGAKEDSISVMELSQKLSSEALSNGAGVSKTAGDLSKAVQETVSTAAEALAVKGR